MIFLIDRTSYLMVSTSHMMLTLHVMVIISYLIVTIVKTLIGNILKKKRYGCYKITHKLKDEKRLMKDIKSCV